MNADIDLKQIEKKAWTTYFQDGLWDIFLGLFMMGGGLLILMDIIWPQSGSVSVWGLLYLGSNLIFGLGVLCVIACKRWITTPRIGRAKFSSARLRKQKFIVLVIAVLFFLYSPAFLIIMSGFLNSTIIFEVSLGMYVLQIIAIFAMGYFLDVWRFYLYGLLLAIAQLPFAVNIYTNSFSDAARAANSTLLMILGAPALIIGLVLLRRFIRKYPKIIDRQALDRGVNDNV